jgi:amino acid transporter
VQSYNGWGNVYVVAGEVAEAAKTVPRAAMISLPLITLCYVWLNAAFFLTLPLATIDGAETLAVDFAENLGGKPAGKVVIIGVALSAFGALNGSLFGASRLVHACGQDGTLPAFFGGELVVAGKQTPVVGIVLQLVVASVLVAAVGSFATIVRIYIFAQWLFYLVTMVRYVINSNIFMACQVLKRTAVIA